MGVLPKPCLVFTNSLTAKDKSVAFFSNPIRDISTPGLGAKNSPIGYRIQLCVCRVGIYCCGFFLMSAPFEIPSQEDSSQTIASTVLGITEFSPVTSRLQCINGLGKSK